MKSNDNPPSSIRRADSQTRTSGAPRPPALSILWSQINSPLTWVLLGIAALVVALGRTSDGLIVAGVALLSALIFFVWELLQKSRGSAVSGSLEAQRRAALDLGRSRIAPPPPPLEGHDFDLDDDIPPAPAVLLAPPSAEPTAPAAPTPPPVRAAALQADLLSPASLGPAPEPLGKAPAAQVVRALWTPVGPCEVSGHAGETAGRFSRLGEPLSEAPGDIRRLLLFASLPGDVHPGQDGKTRRSGADAAEDALATAAEWAGVEVLAARRAFPCRAVVGGPAAHSLSASLHEDFEGGLRVILRGTPDEVLSRCVERSTSTPLPALDTPDIAQMPAEGERLAARGLTVVAVADRAWVGEGYNLTPEALASGFRFTGFVGLASDS